MEMQTHKARNTGNRLWKRNLIIESEEKRQLERQKQKWQDRNKTYLQEKRSRGFEDRAGFVWCTMGASDVILLT